jgi:hypothetical protein
VHCGQGCFRKSFAQASRFACVDPNNQFLPVSQKAFVDLKEHNQVAAPAAFREKDGSHVQDLTPPVLKRDWPPSSPASTDTSMSVDWVDDTMERSFDETKQQIEFHVEGQEGSESVPLRKANEAQANTVSPVVTTSIEVQGSHAMEEDYDSVNSMDEDDDSIDSMEEDDDSVEEALSVVVAREFRQRRAAIGELRECLIESLGPEHAVQYTLGGKSVNTQEPATPVVPMVVELADEPTFWTKSGRKFATKEAARRYSPSSSIGAGTIHSSAHEGGDSGVYEVIQRDTWKGYEEDLCDFDMDFQDFDGDTELAYEPSEDDEDDDEYDSGDMDVDSDEDDDFEIEDVHWTEARALW